MSLLEREHRPAYAVLFASFVLFGTSWTVIGAALPRVLADFAWDYLAAGFVIAAGSLGYFLSAYIAGRLVDRIGFRVSMVLGLALDALGLLAFATTASAPLNALLYFLIGVGQGFIEVAVTPSMIWRNMMPPLIAALAAIGTGLAVKTALIGYPAVASLSIGAAGVGAIFLAVLWLIPAGRAALLLHWLC